jgi:hypothetical protein
VGGLHKEVGVAATSTCSNCGAPAAQDRALIPVVDELGQSAMCGLCLIGLLARLGREVTVFVARPTALPT